MKTQLPPILETKLANFRKRVWIVKLTEGLLAAVFSLALSYLIIFGLDRLMETPSWLRLTILITGAVTLGLGLPLKWHRWVWKQRQLEDAARLLRRTFPRLGDQLLGIVELAKMESAELGRSGKLVEAAMAQAAEQVKDRDFKEAVPNPKHRQWFWAAGAAVLLTVVGFVFLNEAARNTFARWVTPWREVDRFTFAKVEEQPVKIVVPYAESFGQKVKLAEDTQWSPSKGSGRISKQGKISTQLEKGEYRFQFPPQKSDVPLKMSLGDARESILIQPRTRPELKEMKVNLQLPSYLEYTTDQNITVQGGSVSVVKGAQASFEATMNRDLVSAKLDGNSLDLEAGKIITPHQLVNEDTERKFDWQDEYGLTPREPLVLKVSAAEDESPQIFAKRETQEQVILESEVVTFDVTAADDFGVKRIGVEWIGTLTEPDSKLPIRGEKLASSGAPETKDIETRATFCASREGVEPQTLEVRLWAEDYFPERERSRSTTFILHIVNKTDHALWLTEEFNKWLGSAKENYEKEQLLHQTNKDLRALSATDLDRPENRRRLAGQAAAEKAQSLRLSRLTKSGRNLVEQATKNDEFDAERLESWATMLKALKEISDSRMPSVADLLKQAATAPGSGKQPSPNTNTNSPPQQQGGKPSSGKSSSPSKSGAPSVAKGAPPQGAQKPATPADPNAKPKPASPSISDREAGFMKQAKAKPADAKAAPKKSGGGKLTLPTTQLGAAPDKGDQPSKPQSPAQEKLDQAINEQKDLLADFAEITDQLSEILASLEASTFVKRFKAASRKQMSIASTISKNTLDSFGIKSAKVPTAEKIAKTAKDQSEVVRVIKGDLQAYFNRKQDARFKSILDEMTETKIVRALDRGSNKVPKNLTGQGLIGSEYWADILDRWAEELVAASNCKSCSSCSGDSLPPEIVLKVMQALRDEIKLRDETRELENSRSALKQKKYTSSAAKLSNKQGEIADHTKTAISDILELPQGAQKFGKELKLLNVVTTIMKETQNILISPDTGEHAIAAETEVIELLLQAKRPGKGGGGGNPGGGGTAASASFAALADLGPGSDADTSVIARSVNFGTGNTGMEFPEEFRNGLDSYFNNLEKDLAQ